MNMLRFSFCFLFLWVSLCCCSREVVSTADPKPNIGSVVKFGNARFIILTENLIRMEWDMNKNFNDDATFAFINRNLPVPAYKVNQNNSLLTIETAFLKLKYNNSLNYSFSKNNLNINVTVNGSDVPWYPKTAEEDKLGGNLKGTLRTLDGALGKRELDCYKQTDPQYHCQLGLISRDGYVVVDDTNHPRFDASDWPWAVNKSYPAPSKQDCSSVSTSERQSCGVLGISEFDCTGIGCCYDSTSEGHSCYYSKLAIRDLYFFGHGHNYKLALKEFTMVAGSIPLPPRFAFGVFFSRYWAYSDIEEMNIVKQYEQHQIPLDVLVTDMDWHITFYSQASQGKKDQAGGELGWTGFTWDNHLFPNPKAFLDWCKIKGLKNTLNLHPFSGIQPWEEKYSEMARVTGIDPTTSHYVPLDLANQTFVEEWMSIVLSERENEGIDFWWLDWQQGEEFVKIPLVNPTFLLNYIFFTTSTHWKSNALRPLIMHRWGGLGNHRYQVGFSGDVVPAWESLDFQVPFTLSASNVGYGYWSHDIGGHTQPSPPELFTRWVQWGAFSPIFRTHCTKNADNDRRIWVYPVENYEIMRDFLVLRASLVPYIYSYARVASEEGISLLRPMYYEFPEKDSAYSFDKQYYFGSSILVSPITSPISNDTALVTHNVWIPDGTYLSWFSGEVTSGEIVISRSFTLYEAPVWIKAGSIIQMRIDDDSVLLGSAKVIPTKLKLLVFVGDEANGTSLFYEDDGNSTEYLNGKYVQTEMAYFQYVSLSKLVFTLKAVGKNQYLGQPSQRSYQIVFRSFWPADEVSLSGTGKLLYTPMRDNFDSYTENCWTYDGSSLSLIINIVQGQPVDQLLEVTVTYASYKSLDVLSFFPGFFGTLTRLQKAKSLLDEQWGKDTVYQDLYPNFLLAVETGQMITYNPANIISIAKEFPSLFKMGLQEVSKLSNLNSAVLKKILAMFNTQDL